MKRIPMNDLIVPAAPARDARLPHSKRIAAIAGFVSISSLCAVAHADGPPEGGFDLSWNSIDCGGETASAGGSFALAGTIGQPDAGAPMTGGQFSLTGGFVPGITTAPSTPPCPADIFPVGAGSGDGAVGPGDLGQLLSQWGPCASPCPADLFPVASPDGNVGPGDLGQLLSQWGQCG
jgi:hypothetical protein